MRKAREVLGPLWPYVVLTAIPAAAFILPDVFGGHILMTGDNAQQNYPLHVLVGSMIRHGQLPFWNPYIFSGSPLLADFNAGAFYPLVGLFVILPDRAAWIATEVILFSGIAIGMYVFLRALALSTYASVAAAATFAFSGQVLSQVNHVDMTEGFVALPVMLLAVLKIVRDGRWRWAVLFGVAQAVVILGGAPEAMLDEALFVIAYTVMSAGFDRSRWWRVVSRLAPGAALGLALSALEWLPGLSAIANSQRSGFGSNFAAAGSYPPADGLLAIVPYLYGGYRHLGEAGFFATYNLPEIEIYIGVLPIVALLALLHPRWPSRLPGRDRLTWYVVGLVALLLALGGNTPFEHLFNSIPLYGHQRLQSRNMVGVSAAACVLFAGWLDRRQGSSRELLALDRVIAFVPAAMALGLAGWALIDPNSLLSRLPGVQASPTSVHTVREATAIALAFACVAGLIVVGRTFLRPTAWMWLVGVFVAADLGLVAGTSQLATFPSNSVLAGTMPVEKYLAAHLSPGARYDLYDPQGYSNGPSGTNVQPDDNILAHLATVSGYASIVNATYNTVTETHTQGDLNVTALGNGELDDLDLQLLVSFPQYFMLPLTGSPQALKDVEGTTEGRNKDPVLPLGYRPASYDIAYPSYTPPRPALSPGRIDGWYYGERLHAADARLLFTRAPGRAVVRLGAVEADGTIRWGLPTVVHPGATSVSGGLPGGDSVGLAVDVLSGRIPGHQALVSAGGTEYELDGALSSAVYPGPWRFGDTVGMFTIYENATAPHPVHVTGVASGTVPGVQVLSSTTKSETLRVKTGSPLDVVRDVAWDSGWRATVSVNGGPARAVAVEQSHLVQEVHVPAGDDIVTFAYRPPHLLTAIVLSLGGVGALGALLAGWLVRSRRRRSAVGPGEGEKEFALLGAPHAVDDEAGVTELVLDPLGGELGADLRE